MPITMFSFVGLYDRTLGSLAHLLDKGVAFATEQGVDPESILHWRLIDDMHPLRFKPKSSSALRANGPHGLPVYQCPSG